MCVCASFLAGSGGPASRARSGAPHLFLWPLCPSALLGPLRAGVAPFLFLCLPLFFFLRCSLCAPLLSLAFSGFRPRPPWALALCFSFHPSPPSCVFFFSSRPLCAPVVSGFLWFPAPGALGLGAVCCLFCWSAASRLRVRSRCCCVSCLAVRCSLVVAAPPPPPPLLCLAVFVAAARCSFCFFCFFFACSAPTCWLGARRRFSPSAPPPPFSCLFRWSPAARLSVCSCCLCVSHPAVGCSLVAAAPPPPPLLCLPVFVAAARCSVFFSFFFLCCFAFACLLGARRRFSPSAAPPPPPPLLLFVLLVSRCSALRVLSLLLCFPPGRWLLLGGCPPPSPLCVSRFSSLSLGAPFFFPSSAALLPPACLALVGGSRRLQPPPPPRCVRGALCCPVLPCCDALPSGVLRCRDAAFRLFAVWFAVSFWSALPCAVLCCVSLGAVVRRAVARCAARCCAVVCCVVLLRSLGAVACCAVPFGAARRPGALCFAALCFAVFPRAVCFVLCVFCRGVLVRAVVRHCALCCVCPGVSCCAFPVFSALCGAVLRCVGALALCCSCGACYCWRLVLWCTAVCCAVSFGVLWGGAGSGRPWLSAGGVFRCRCPCRAAWFASLWLVRFAVVPCFPVSCAVLSRGAVLSCSAVLLGCCLCLLCPPVAFRAAPCCAVLCCWLSVAFFAWWWRLCALVPFPSLPLLALLCCPCFLLL